MAQVASGYAADGLKRAMYICSIGSGALFRFLSDIVGVVWVDLAAMREPRILTFAQLPRRLVSVKCANHYAG